MSNIPMQEVPIPTIDELGLDKFMAAGNSARSLLDERSKLKSLIDQCSDRIKDIDTELGNALDLIGAKTAVYEDSLIIRRGPSRPRAILDRVLLLDAGVTPQQLEAGTKLSDPGKPGITVRAISETKTQGFYEPARERGIASS